MAKKVPGLGRAFSSLISVRPPDPPEPNASPAPNGAAGATAGPVGAPAEIPLDAIDPCPKQPRKHFDTAALDELASSIREQGLIQPLVVRRAGDRYELIAGERRFRALQRLELKTAPAIIKDVAGPRVLELALVENLQRQDLDPLETAEACEALIRENGYTQEKLAERLGTSRVNVTNKLRLLKLPEEVKGLVGEGKLSEGHARAVLGLPDYASQIRLAKRVAAEGLSVRETEKLATPTARKPAASKPSPTMATIGDEGMDPNLRELQERLSRHLGSRVVVRDRGGRGVIEIHYDTPEESSRVLSRMGLRPE